MIKMVPYGRKSKIIAVDLWLSITFFELFLPFETRQRKNNNCAGRINCTYVLYKEVNQVSVSRQKLILALVDELCDKGVETKNTLPVLVPADIYITARNKTTLSGQEVQWEIKRTKNAIVCNKYTRSLCNKNQNMLCVECGKQFFSKSMYCTVGLKISHY